MCIINTGLVTFDKQTSFFGIGNVASNTQFSSFLSLESFDDDIKVFDLQYDYRKLVEDFTKDNCKSVLYKFFFTKRGEEETIGYILTDKYKEKYQVFGARTQKRRDALHQILKALLLKESVAS